MKKLAALVLAGVLSIMALAGCGFNADDTIATLGDQKISAGLANFMIKYQKAAYDDVYVSYYGEKVWNMDFYGTGSTLADDLKSSMMTTLHNLYTLKAHMDDYKVTLTDDEKKAISEAAKAFMKDNSEEALKELGATEEYVEEMLTLYTIQNKMYEAIVVGADHEVKDEDANMRAYSLISIGTTGYYDTKNQFVTYTDAEKEKVQETIKKFDEALDAEGADFEKLAKEYLYEVKTGTYAKDNTSMDKDLKKAMDALKEGEISAAVKTEKTTYFVRIDKETDEKATEENRKAIIEKRENEFYNKELEKLQKEDGWTVDKKVVKKIDFHNLLTQKDPNAPKETEKNTEKNTEKDTEKGTETSTEKGTETESTETTEAVDGTEGK